MRKTTTLEMRRRSRTLRTTRRLKMMTTTGLPRRSASRTTQGIDSSMSKLRLTTTTKRLTTMTKSRAKISNSYRRQTSQRRAEELSEAATRE